MANPWFFDVYPNRPQPYIDEGLSGYLLRLAAANGVMRFEDFVVDLFPMWPFSQRLNTLRWEYPVDDWGRIPLRTQLPLATLCGLTVIPWLQKFRSLPTVTHKHHLGPGHVLHDIVQPQLQVCPLCLQSQPYIRLLWRLENVCACLDHACLLRRHCHRCGMALTVVGPTNRHLHCAHCAADLRTLPVVCASSDVLAKQRNLQTDVRFLLNPSVALTTDAQWAGSRETLTLSQAIGLKFRYLRRQTGQSLSQIAHQVLVAKTTLGKLERGGGVPLALYPAYLATLVYSWADFAALELPVEFLAKLDKPPHLPLRICPTPNCPNHRQPSHSGVTMLRDMPDQQMVRFRCNACRLTFTRSYTGERRFIARKPSSQPGAPPTVAKSQAEIVRLTEWGLQGIPNRHIAQRLGWSEKTVRMYWIALNIEAQVHTAQRQRVLDAQQKRRTDLRRRIDTLLQDYRDQDVEITIRQICRGLGYDYDYLQAEPDLLAHVRTMIGSHNRQVRQRRQTHLCARTNEVLAELHASNEPVTLQILTERIGLSITQLCTRYPELLALIQSALPQHRAKLKTQRSQRECSLINEAATSLAAQGIRITTNTLFQEAGLSKGRLKVDPVLRDICRGWIGNFAPRD